MPLTAPYRLAWDVPLSDAAYDFCKNYLGCNAINGISLYDSTQEQIDYMFFLCNKYDLYVSIWALFLPSERERLITQVKDEPYLWNFELFDEPESGCENQENCYNEIKGYAPNVPLMTVHSPGYVWCIDAFDIQAWDLYPCGQPDPIAYLHGKIVTLGNAAKIQQALALGKEFIPFLHTWGGVPWCVGCEVINSPAFPEYNGMEGVKAQYLKWKEMAGGHADGACAYNYSGFTTTPCGINVMQPQIRNLFFGLLGAPLAVSGGLSFEGGLTADKIYRKVYKFIGGSLTMTKSLVKSLFYPLSGSVSSSGSLKKLLYSGISGVLSLSGDLDTPFWETIKKNVSGSLTFTSTLTHKIVKKLLGLIIYGKYKYSDLNNLLWSQLETLTWQQLQTFDAGSLTKKVKLALAGRMADGFAPRGYIMGKEPSLRACEKTWSFIQTLTWTQFQEYFWCKHILYIRSLGGGVGMSGTPGRHLQKPLSGSFGFNPTENLFLKVKPVLSSALSLGGVAKRLIHFLTTGVSNLTGSPKIKALLTASGGINLYGKVSTGVGALRKLLYKLIQLIERHGV